MTRIIKSILILCVAQIAFAYQNIPCLWYWLKIACGFPVQKVLKKINPSQKVAIVAAFQKKQSISFELMLTELRSKGFEILLVSNTTLSDGFESWVLERVDGLIVRENVGRDLGAYKSGFLYLHDEGFLNAVERLLFINDTIFFPVVDSERFWEKMLSIDAEAVGAYESFCSGYHLQSFFMLVNKPLINSNCLYSFWKNYVVWNSRKHAVFAGEIGFSQFLKKNGVRMSAYVNAQSAIGAFHKESVNKRSLLGIVRKLLNERDRREVMGKSVLDPEYQSLATALEKINPSHALCEFALTELQLPILKKDLVYRGTLSLVDLVRISESQDMKIPLSELQAAYREKGLPSERGLWKRFMLGIGVQ
jgi:hypothetical protein